MGKAQIKILGTSFSIQTEENHEYLEEVLAYYKTKVDEIAEKAIATDPLKTAILAGLNIVDELFKEKYHKPGTSPSAEVSAIELNRITTRLINKINGSLDEKEG